MYAAIDEERDLMGRMRESPRLSRQVLVFAAVGVLNTAVDTGVFLGLRRCATSPRPWLRWYPMPVEW
ncbi:hypothetical protein TC41_0639 [Alicyclobacillus acidocaldarius subsp. acidocaldarius Tc-4-1]|uniref:Uncharacterized protein n=2 Tax=Alicyclobacillus acidocaldarius TaxID=405212 RepID=F8IDU4_ALIAT|nr:hypothetical protein TC41_0639 [Alicyclobacillus acidocaldarius subsp. acidocaldarius Tc-4-1]